MQRIAKVLKSNGNDGGLLLSFPDIDLADIDLQEPVFIVFDGLPVPFYFESFTPRGSSRAVVHLTGVRSLQDADELAGAEVFADYFELLDEEDFTGFTVCDAQGKAVGIVKDYEEIPGNTCLWVERPDGRQILLPFHEELIIGTDEKTGTLVMNIPEGLLDL